MSWNDDENGLGDKRLVMQQMTDCSMRELLMPKDKGGSGPSLLTTFNTFCAKRTYEAAAVIQILDADIAQALFLLKIYVHNHICITPWNILTLVDHCWEVKYIYTHTHIYICLIIKENELHGYYHAISALEFLELHPSAN